MVLVHRFQTDRERKPRKFDRFSQHLYTVPTRIDEVEWMVQQDLMPCSDSSTKNMRRNIRRLFFIRISTLPHFLACNIKFPKSIFVSTAHDELRFILIFFRTLFHLPQALLYLTEEEKALVHRLFHNEHIPYEVLGTGVNSLTARSRKLSDSNMGFRLSFALMPDALTKGRAAVR